MEVAIHIHMEVIIRIHMGMAIHTLMEMTTLIRMGESTTRKMRKKKKRTTTMAILTPMVGPMVILTAMQERVMVMPKFPLSGPLQIADSLGTF